MQPADLDLPAKFDDYRPGQLDTIFKLIEHDHRFQLLSANTGAGKSIIYMSWGKLVGGRILILTGTKGLQRQLLADFASMGLVEVKGKANYRCPNYGSCDEPGKLDCSCHYAEMGMCSYQVAVDKARGAEFVVANFAYWMSLEKYSNGRSLGEFDAVVVDECLPPGEYVGSKRIADIRVGDLVPAFDEVTGELRTGRVSAVMSNPVKSLVRLSYGDRSLVCTPAHPVFTPQGWVPAGKLRQGDLVMIDGDYDAERWDSQVPSAGGSSVPLVSVTGHRDGSAEVVRVPQNPESLLLDSVLDGVQAGNIKSTGGESRSSRSVGETHDQQQSHARRFDESEDGSHSQRHELEAESEWREWQTDTSTCDSLNGCTRAPRLETGVCSVNRGAERWPADELQAGSGETGLDDSDRGGWSVAFGSKSQTEGRKENQVLEIARLDSVEILEPGCDGTFGGLCPDGLVYNIEVEKYNTYITNGLAVHNCHSAPDWLADFCTVELDTREIKQISAQVPGTPPPPSTDDDDPNIYDRWAEWLKSYSYALRTYASQVDEQREKTRLNGLSADLNEIAASIEESGLEILNQAPGAHYNWAFERDQGVLKISPVWAHKYAERYLFRGIQKVLLCSATLSPMTAQYLGITEHSYVETDSGFDPSRRPFIYIPTTRVDYRMGEGQIRQLVNRIDMLIEARLDRKGVIHARSYARAREIAARSRNKDLLYLHDSRNARETIEAFKRAQSPAVLISPAVEEGYDFPHDQCRYQIIVKVPFVDGRQPVIKMRNKLDSKYTDYLTVQSLVQMVGRGMRSADDMCETMILDDHWAWFQAKGVFPKWFKAAWRRSTVLPPPLDLSSAVAGRVIDLQPADDEYEPSGQPAAGYSPVASMVDFNHRR